jgi:hypothetical protein
VRGRQDAHVGGDRLDRAQRLVDALLQNAQQARLHGRRNVADFVQKDRPALGQGKAAGFVPPRVRERAGFVAEQFRFQQRVGQGAAVDGHEGLILAPRQRVDGAGEQLLAGAAGALDQHRAFAVRQQRQQLEHLPHRRAAAHNIGKAVFSLEFLAEVFDQAQIAERLHASDDVSAAVLEDGRRNTDRDPLAFDAQDIDGLVRHRAARGERLAQGARRFADAGPEHLAARTSQGFQTLDAGDSLGRPIERRDLPFPIHGEHAVVDRVEDDAVEFVGIRLVIGSHRLAVKRKRRVRRILPPHP